MFLSYGPYRPYHTRERAGMGQTSHRLPPQGRATWTDCLFVHWRLPSSISPRGCRCLLQHSLLGNCLCCSFKVLVPGHRQFCCDELRGHDGKRTGHCGGARNGRYGIVNYGTGNFFAAPHATLCRVDNASRKLSGSTDQWREDTKRVPRFQPGLRWKSQYGVRKMGNISYRPGKLPTTCECAARIDTGQDESPTRVWSSVVK